MKRKLTLILLTCVACIALAGCIVLAACKDNTPTYAITWNVDEHVTVNVDGYDNLPETVKNGTEIAFTATPDNGYEITSVAPSSIKKDGDTYKFTVSDKDFTVTIRASKSIDGITATLKDASKIYYAGDEITAEDLTVTVKYKAGDSEVVTSGIAIAYEEDGREALAIGDTEVTVSYRGHSDEVTLPLLSNEEGVVALVTIDTLGGELTSAYLNKINGQAHYAYNGGVATFTHKGDLAEDIDLPALGTTNVDGEVTKGEEGDYTLKGWTDGKNEVTKITNSTVSVTYTLVAEPNLLVIDKIYYKLEGDVPYLIIEGTYKAAESAYLYLYEGKKDISLKGEEVTGKRGETFQLKFDMTKLVDAGSEYEGAFMDLKFQAQFGDRVETQAINLEDYEGIDDFVNTNQSIKFKHNDKWYKAEFRVWTEDGGHDLKVIYVSYPGYEATEVSLKKDEETPYVVIEGIYDAEVTGAEVTDQATLLAAVKALYFDWQNNDGANGNGWGTFISNGDDTVKAVEVTYNAEGAHSFKITFDISVLKDGDIAFAHFGASEKNLEVLIGESTIEIGSVIYTVKNWDGWGSNLVCIFVDDTAAQGFDFDNNAVNLEEDGGKVYIVVEGTYKNYDNEEALKAALLGVESNACDAENSSGGARTDLSEGLTVTVNAGEGTFVAKIDVTDLNAGTYWMHFAGKDIRNTKLPEGVENDGKTFKFIGKEESWGTAYLLEVTEANPTVYTVISYELDEVEGDPVMIIKGTVVNYKEGKKPYIATVYNGEGYATVVRTDEATIVVEDGNFTVTWNLLNLDTDSLYWIHFESGDLPGNLVNEEKLSVTVYGLTYTMTDYNKDSSGLLQVSGEFTVPEPEGTEDDPIMLKTGSVTVTVPESGEVYYSWYVMGFGTVKLSFIADSTNISLKVYNSLTPEEEETYTSTDSGFECTITLEAGLNYFVFSTKNGNADEYTISVTEEQGNNEDEEGTENNPYVIESSMLNPSWNFTPELDSAEYGEVWYTYTVQEGQTLYFSWGEGTAINVMYPTVSDIFPDLGVFDKTLSSTDPDDIGTLKGGLTFDLSNGNVIKIKAYSEGGVTTNLSFTVSTSPIGDDNAATTYEPNYELQNPTGTGEGDVVGETAVESGKWGLWWTAGNWGQECGDIVTMTDRSANAADKSITVSYAGGSVDFSVQLFYRDSRIEAGKTYTITLSVNVSAALQVKINGEVKNLTEGLNQIEITWTASDAGFTQNGTTFSMQMYGLNGMDGTDSMTVTVSNIVYTEVSAD